MSAPANPLRILIPVLVALTAVVAACAGDDANVGRYGSNPGPTAILLSTPEAGKLPLRVTAIGDSVMLAATDRLEAGGIEVDAEVSRGVPAALDVLRDIVDRGQLGDEVLVHIGHNSAFTPEEVDEFMALAAGRPVVFFTVKVPTKEWEQPNNEVMRQGAERYPNLRVVEWEKLVANRPDLFWDDGIHLRPAGADFYADFVAAVLE